MTKKPNERSRYRWLRRLLRVVVVLFVILNVMAAFHAYKLTHNFKGEPGRVKGPDQMSFGAKLKALFFGVKNYKSAINTFPDVAYATIKLYTENKLEIEAWLINNDTAKG